MLFLDNVFVSMGVGFLLVMVVVIFYLEKKIVVVCGDGGFMMNL